MSKHIMNTHDKTCSVSKRSSTKQQGVVLFFALIALVIMSLAAVALIRSVDTSTIIAGNLASKQSATSSADSGLETALSWMDGIADYTTLNVDDAAQGYYATQALDPTTLNWNNADSKPATGSNITAGTDTSGNSIRYVIQRMCRTNGASNPGGCLFGAPVVGSNSQGVKDAPSAGANTSTEQSPIYRVTARVVGVKNTISYIQAFVY
jgi:type IV pilus assembly protein PilX